MDAALHRHWLAATREFWNARSEFDARYRRICASGEFLAAVDVAELRRRWDDETDRIMPVILKGVPLTHDWACLEIGCGIGRLMKPLARRCRRVIGVDVSERMAEWAATYLADVPNAEVHVNDGVSLPMVADASVDFVYSHLAFQHITLVEVVDAYLAEIARVLRVGGFCRIQNWREPRPPVTEVIKDVVRPLLGRRRYRSARFWEWTEGRRVEFGGVTFHPRAWKRRLRSHGLRPVALDLGVGHDFWMWTTSVRASG